MLLIDCVFMGVFPAVMTQPRTETFALTDGNRLRVTVAEPDSVVRGGLVVLHEARGMTERVRHLVGVLAEEGWLVIAPHLYYRDGADEIHEEHSTESVDAQVRRLSGEAVLADTDASFLWLTERGVRADQLGVIGFDMGGTVAAVVAANRTLGAAISVGGTGLCEPLSTSLPSLIEVVGELACPWLGLYGSEGDGGEVDKLREVGHRNEVVADVVRFEGAGHRFDRNPEAATEAWRRVRSWFDMHLR